ncbi:MAG: putative colanic acid biosynthesis acetyltransferase [Lentisphaerota bacterium]
MQQPNDHLPIKSEHSLINRCARFAWGLIWLFLFRPSPRICHGWRTMLLRLFGAKINGRVKIYNTVQIWAPWNLEVGEGSVISDYVNCYCVAPITIGRQVIISQYSYLCAATHDYTDASFPLRTNPLVVHDKAWVAADVLVGPGVVIGEGAVIGARSSVFKSVNPWVVVAGNPARFMKKRVLKSKDQPDEHAGASAP